jgi:hypothetical protein
MPGALCRGTLSAVVPFGKPPGGRLHGGDPLRTRRCLTTALAPQRTGSETSATQWLLCLFKSGIVAIPSISVNISVSNYDQILGTN